MQIKKQRMYIFDLAVDVFYDRNCDFNSKINAVVSLCGFPDFAGPNEMTIFQVGLGNIVFQPHMRGTFDSGGLFGPEGLKESLKLLNTIIWDAKASFYPNSKFEKMPWDIKKLILVGHSFGGMIEIRYFHFLEKLDSIVFVSPAVHYEDKYGCEEDGLSHYAEVRRKYPYTYRLESAEQWNGILEGKDLLPESPIGNVKNVAVIYGNMDRYFNLEKAKKTVPNLIESFIKADKYSFDIIKNAGHPLAEILADKRASEVVREICFGD